MHANGRRNASAAEKPLRIAILSEFVHPFHKGGAERRYYEIGSRLVSRGHEVHWYAMQHWPGDADTTFEGIHLHAVSPAIDVYAPGGGRSIGAGLRLSWALTRALRRAPQPLDVIDCSLYPFFHVLGARAVRPRTPSVVSWYEFWGDHWYEYLGWRGFFGKQVERLAARSSDRIIAVSDLAEAALLADGVARERVEMIPLGVDVAWIDSIDPAVETSDVIFFGRLKNHKNVDVLLRAIALVKQSRPDLTCAIVGNGPERGRLTQLAGELGLERQVRFHGELPDEQVIAVAKASRLFVQPSTKEGGGSIALLEANACGLPAIGIDHPLGLDHSLIEEDRNGWWAQPGVEPLAATISDALESPDRLAALRASSRAFAAGFDWGLIADLCEASYRNAADHAHD
jgi:glycosyltransferase involved in cell wall biosynthesis